jgi:hypothetical protein
MRLHQEGTYQPILVELLEALTGFDTALASGFENPLAAAEAQAQEADAARKAEHALQTEFHPLGQPPGMTTSAPEAANLTHEATV